MVIVIENVAISMMVIVIENMAISMMGIVIENMAISMMVIVIENVAISMMGIVIENVAISMMVIVIENMAISMMVIVIENVAISMMGIVIENMAISMMAALQTPWSDVFPSETVTLSCSVAGGSDWTYTWNRDGHQVALQEPDVSVGSDGASLNISSARQEHAGQYTCIGQQYSRPVQTKPSNTVQLKVYGNKPWPILEKDPGFDQLYVGESVSLTCQVKVSSGWEYHWKKDGHLYPTANSGKNTLNISSPSLSDGGKYTCMATRGSTQFSTEDSNTLSLNFTVIEHMAISMMVIVIENMAISMMVIVIENMTISMMVIVIENMAISMMVIVIENTAISMMVIVIENTAISMMVIVIEHMAISMMVIVIENMAISMMVIVIENMAISMMVIVIENMAISMMIPVPRAALQTPWSDVFPSETVTLSCSVAGGSDWTYTWNRDGHQVALQEPDVSVGSDGASLNISSARQEHAGQYTCIGQHKSRPAKTKTSNTVQLKVYANTPLPVITQFPSAKKIYTAEVVSVNCSLDVSTGWEYQWYHNGTPVHTEKHSLITIPSTSFHNSGTYTCKAKRGTPTLFTTGYSQDHILSISDIPKATIKGNTPWSDMFPTESVELTCRAEGSSEWRYMWYRDSKPVVDERVVLSPDGSTLSFRAAPLVHAGQYMCRGQHKERDVSTHNSTEHPLKVYGEFKC
ncbi:Hemicentin-1 [Merluccius polli]|uniref:Hemicentin-1 n=1 Tax=Merluccius polli TaxID=89951 RepID=A0AA47MTG6_MERPO|nr:Hemicentin-1 [Merluccius polli]